MNNYCFVEEKRECACLVNHTVCIHAERIMWAGISHIVFYIWYIYIRWRPRERVINRSKSVPKLNPTLPADVGSVRAYFSVNKYRGHAWHSQRTSSCMYTPTVMLYCRSESSAALISLHLHTVFYIIIIYK